MDGSWASAVFAFKVLLLEGVLLETDLSEEEALVVVLGALSLRLSREAIPKPTTAPKATNDKFFIIYRSYFFVGGKSEPFLKTLQSQIRGSNHASIVAEVGRDDLEVFLEGVSDLGEEFFLERFEEEVTGA